MNLLENCLSLEKFHQSPFQILEFFLRANTSSKPYIVTTTVLQLIFNLNLSTFFRSKHAGTCQRALDRAFGLGKLRHSTLPTE